MAVPNDFISAARMQAASCLATSVPEQLAIPDTLNDKYRLLHRLGYGGMGSVYAALQHDNRDEPLRKVAIKLIRPDRFSVDSVSRLSQEAKALADLQHPAIATIHDTGLITCALGAIPFLAMELIDGFPLTIYAEIHALSVRDRLKLFVAVCGGVQYAHRKQIIHCDLKPSNILVTFEGQPKIVDFGIAQRRDLRAALYATASPIGTPEYMSPEQIQGCAAHVDHCTDVYSLGVTCYELLAGWRPYTPAGWSYGSASQPAHERRYAALQLTCSSHLQKDINEILRIATSWDAKDRYQSVEALARDLQAALNGGTVEARRPWSTTYRLRCFARRHRATVFSVASVVVALTVGLIIALLYAREAHIQRHNADENAAISQRQSYAANMGLSQNAWSTSDITRLRDLLRRPYFLPQGDDLRSFEWRYLDRLSRATRRLMAGPGVCIAVAPDAQLMATAHGHDSMQIAVNAPNSVAPMIISFPSALRAAAFSGDGSLIATIHDDDVIRMWDVSSGRLIRVLQASSAARGATIAVSRTGQYVAATWHNRSQLEVMVWSRDSQKKWILLGTQPLAYNTLVFSPDEQLLASGSLNNIINLWDLRQMRLARTIYCRFGGGFAFSPDSALLAAGEYDGTLHLYTTSNGREVATCAAHNGSVRDLAFSHRGSILCSSGLDGAVKAWSVQPLSEVTQLGWLPANRVCLSFTSDDATVIAGSDVNTVEWSINDLAGPLSRSLGHGVSHVAMSPCGSTLALFGSRNRQDSDSVVTMGLRRIDLLFYSARKASSQPNSLMSDISNYVHKKRGAIRQERPATVSADTMCDLSRSVRTLDDVSPISVQNWDRDDATDISCAAFSPDAALLAQGLIGGEIRLYESGTWRFMTALKREGHSVRALAWPRPDALIAGYEDGSCVIWDTVSKKQISAIPCRKAPVTALCASADGRILARGDEEGWIVSCDLSEKNQANQFQVSDQAVRALAVSSNGTMLATGAGPTARLWDLASGRHLGDMKGHKFWVSSIAFSGDGKTLATGSNDRTIRLWDPVVFQERVVLKGHDSTVVFVAFTPESETMVSVDEMGIVKVWHGSSQ